MPLVYIVEDDTDIREMESYALKNSGLDVEMLASGAALNDALKRQLPDLILLDIMLPDEDGLSILKRLRAEKETQELPIILVTAKTTELDKVRGLDMGADDYLTKPFGIMELVSRVKALLRRTRRQTNELTYETISLDAERHLVTADGEPVELTYKEFELLKFLLQNSGTVVSRDRLMDAVWGFAFAGETRTVDMHIKTLRKKLGESGMLIVTVRNVGYRLGN